MLTKNIISCLLFATILATTSLALDNGLGRTPQMGWNSWNKFACGVNEDIIKQTAEAFVALGLDKLGYEYVNIDDCWSSGRDSNKRLIPDAASFPNGIKALADYVHSLGLKIGIYSDAGTNTCAGRPGSLYYENIDAQTWADWGIDYLKYDNCYNNNLAPKWRYPRMRDALNKTGRPIFYSLCEWGQDDPATWAQTVGNSWRTTGDISANWNSVMSILEQQVSIANLSVIGGWNDPDMLEVGNGNLTLEESKSHFALWALMKAPLILGNDLRSLDNVTKEIITNSEIIAINQDPLGVSGVRVSKKDGIDIWAGPIVNGTAVVILNTNDEDVNTELDLDVVGFHDEEAFVRDLYSHQDLGVISRSVVLSIPTHGVRALKITH